MTLPKLDWFGHIQSVSGYGRHARGLTLNIDLDVIDLAVFDPYQQKQVDLTSEQKQKIAKRQQDSRNNLEQVNAIEAYNFTPWSATHRSYQNKSFSYWNDELYKVLVTVYESPEIPHFWTSLCDQFDEIWTPSRHAMEAFKNSSIRDDMEYRVFREGVDTSHYQPGVEPLVDIDDYVFLSVFDFTYRKGWDKLIAAYCNSFTEDDDVTLLLKTHYGGDDVEQEQYIKRHIKAIEEKCRYSPNIEFYWDWIKEKEMPRLYNSADAFVLPTRGEGFGLPLFEAAACGLPVITTDHFAPTEFLDDNTYWVEKRGMIEYPFDEAVKHEPNCVGLPFANPSVKSLCRQMRKVYESSNPDVPDVSDMDWRTPAKQIEKRVHEIWIEHYE